MTTPHPFDLLYHHRQDPLGLWAEAHARALRAGYQDDLGVQPPEQQTRGERRPE